MKYSYPEMADPMGIFIQIYPEDWPTWVGVGEMEAAQYI